MASNPGSSDACRQVCPWLYTTPLLATDPGECCGKANFLEADFWGTANLRVAYLEQLSQTQPGMRSRLGCLHPQGREKVLQGGPVLRWRNKGRFLMAVAADLKELFGSEG